MVMVALDEPGQLLTDNSPSRPHPRRGQGRAQDLPPAAHLCRQGSRARPHPVLQAVQVDQAVPAA